MLKKSMAFMMLLCLTSPMSAQSGGQEIPLAENLELVPQTKEQAGAFKLGQHALQELLEEKAAKGEQVSSQEVVAAVEQVYATVALRNNEKAIWFALGALSVVGVYLAWNYVISVAWDKITGKTRTTRCTHDHSDGHGHHAADASGTPAVSNAPISPDAPTVPVAPTRRGRAARK